MRRPDFFFVGHPRSGSGLLDSFLKGHPELFMARKELHHFGSDLRYERPPRTLENYLAHFKGAGDQKRVGEASTWTLASTEAAREIHAFRPDARILMLLRNPVSWLHSLHSHLIFSGDECIEDFGLALEAEPERILGQRIPPWSRPANALHYRALTDYPTQVARFFDTFGRDRVHVLILDDFKDNARGRFQEICDFLGVSREFPGMDELLEGSQRARNSNRQVRSPALRDWIRRPEHWRVLQGLEPSPVPGFGLLLRALRRANIEYADRTQMDPALATRLVGEFTPRIEALEDLLGRDLSPWKRIKGS